MDPLSPLFHRSNCAIPNTMPKRPDEQREAIVSRRHGRGGLRKQRNATHRLTRAEFTISSDGFARLICNTFTEFFGVDVVAALEAGALGPRFFLPPLVLLPAAFHHPAFV